MDLQHVTPPSDRRALLGRAAAWLAVAVALAGVLYLYSRPEFLVMLSDMIWACFGGAS